MEIPKLELTLEEQAYRSIRTALVGGAFVPGDRLSIRRVAAALGTSPMPARAALRRLTVEQVLEVLPSGTAVVPLLTRAAFVEMAAIRTRLEPLAAAMAAPRIDRSGIASLSAQVDAMVAALAEGDMDTVLKTNQHFMFDLYRAAAAPMLLGIIETLWLRRGPMYWGARASLLRWRAPFDRHRGVVVALGRHDGEGAAAAIHEEIDVTTNFLLAEIRFADDPAPVQGVAAIQALATPPLRRRPIR
jgi:GntR family colanic acid and biofilm gene transcriptional regulator